MGLRDLSTIGLEDVTEPSSAERAANGTAASARVREAANSSADRGASGGRIRGAPGPGEGQQAPPARRRPARPRARATGTAGSAAAVNGDGPAPLLSEEERRFVQIMVPPELHARLEDASYALGVEHRKLRHHKTILGALVWRYVDPKDPGALRELGATLDDYLDSGVGDAPARVKVGAHLPFSLKHRLDGAAMVLRRTQRAASAKTLLSALVWKHVDPSELGPLVELLDAYHDATRPVPAPLASVPVI